MTKTLRLGVIVLTVLALLLSVSVLTAAAANGTNDSPTAAVAPDNQTHTIPANSSMWYRFDYAGDKSQITVTLVNGNNTGLQFEVFTPAQIGDWADETPIGRGTAQSINCNTGAPGLSGACLSNDLIWTGRFNASGTYYVAVMNNTASSQAFQLSIVGDGVALASQTPTGSPTQPATSTRTITNSKPSNTGGAAAPAPSSSQPAAAAAKSGTNTSPAAAAVIDNQTHSILANSSLWYRFDYAGDKSQILITLVNGSVSGLKFNLFTPAQIGDWFNETPIGRGTAQPLNCDTGVPVLYSSCYANDLTWSGQFNGSGAGTYYVEVVNNAGSAINAQLTVSGSGVSLAPQTATSTGSTTQPTTTTQTNTPTQSTTSTQTTAATAPNTNPNSASSKSATTNSVVANTDPGRAAFIDNAPHTIPANSSAWYKFNYAGDKSQITVALLNGSNSGTAFKVFTPAQIGDWWETAPIGQGTVQMIDCTTGMPSESGGCQSNDLIWIGQFNAGGTYYVEVMNNNSNPVTAQIKIQGDSVSLSQ